MIELAYFSGLTRREIAASDAVSVGTVKSRMRLGMRKLAVALGAPATHSEFDGQR